MLRPLRASKKRKQEASDRARAKAHTNNKSGTTLGISPFEEALPILFLLHLHLCIDTPRALRLQLPLEKVSAAGSDDDGEWAEEEGNSFEEVGD